MKYFNEVSYEEFLLELLYAFCTLTNHSDMLYCS